MENLADTFGEPISVYTRTQAIEDGVLVDLMQDTMLDVCRQHYKYPVACTLAVFDIMERAVANNKYCNDFAGILHDMLNMSKVYFRRLDDQTRLFTITILGAGQQRNYTFKMVCGPDDNAEPCLTILLPDED
jgi:hypothetical protein